MFFLTPWSLARRAVCGRRSVLLLVLAALLYGFGMHAAKACQPGMNTAHPASVSAGEPCHHGAAEVDLAEAACEVHCRTDTQTGRTSVGFDLAAVAPAVLIATLAPVDPLEPAALDVAPPRRDSGPPLHILLHRLLR
jgi:hypothetical protein